MTDTIEKIYYSIGEVERKTGVNQTRIRFWMRKFGLDVKRAHEKTHVRMFKLTDIEDIKEIDRLLNIELYTIEGAKRKFYQTGILKVKE
jgi:DNA-binding transcriptional MerR regulator